MYNDNDGSVCGSDSAFYKQSEGKKEGETFVYVDEVSAMIWDALPCKLVCKSFAKSLLSAMVAMISIYRISFF